MKVKKKAAAAAAFFSVAMSFSACHNYDSGAYGPPAENFDDAVTQSETENISDNTEDENTGDDEQ